MIRRIGALRDTARVAIKALDRNRVSSFPQKLWATGDTSQRWSIGRSEPIGRGPTSAVQLETTHVRLQASVTGLASAEVLASARSLSTESQRLKLEIQKFVAQVRAQ